MELEQQSNTAVGTLTKAGHILDALELGPQSLTELCVITGLPRPTCHRLAVALEDLRLVARDGAGRFTIGDRPAELARARDSDALLAAAGPTLRRLRDETSMSSQLYRRRGDHRICVATAEPLTGLRDTVPVGSDLTMAAGSAAQILLAWTENPGEFGERQLAAVRRQGWAESAGQRQPGVASVSAPVRIGAVVVAALSISGPIDLMGRHPGRQFGPVIAGAAADLSSLLSA